MFVASTPARLLTPTAAEGTSGNVGRGRHPDQNKRYFNETVGYNHRDRTRASTLCCFCLIFFSFEHAKNLLIMGPNNTKNSSKSVIFSYLTMNNIVRILLLL